ncbi:MAG: pilus assembly protein PilP [Candidatus Polarisedimenticolaceae bacterium]|nr:pilus assembly protein PilP [Candidatus Polarisedimenticolaceae bacterium]
MIFRHSSIRVLLVALSSVLLGACGEPGMQDLRQYIDQVKERSAGQIESLPEVKSVETFIYIEGERRDPFSLSGEDNQEDAPAIAGGISPDNNRRKEELERYPLTALKMVGLLEQHEEFWGLVVADDGTIHRVRSGNYLGQDHGQILRITENRIEMVEIVADGLGSYRERSAFLALSE